MEAPYATGKYTAAALRSRPRNNAPLRSQLLLGEPVTITGVDAGFARVELSDETEPTGAPEFFVRLDQLQGVDEQLHTRQRDSPAFALDLFSTLMGERFGLPVTFGARLPGYDGLQLRHLGERFVYSGQAVRTHDIQPDAQLLLRLARKWLYVPEMSGGRTPSGIGKVALIRMLMRVVGYELPRRLDDMSRAGRTVDFLVQYQEADLAFFGDRGRIRHLGILLPGSQVLHVHGRVRIDAIDHFGIFDLESGRYSHQLRVVKRWLPDRPRQTVELRETFSNALQPTGQTMLF